MPRRGRRGDGAEAARRWEAIRLRFDTGPDGAAPGSEALRKSGRLVAAAVVAAGLFISPRHAGIQAQHKALADPVSE